MTYILFVVVVVVVGLFFSILSCNNNNNNNNNNNIYAHFWQSTTGEQQVSFLRQGLGLLSRQSKLVDV